MRPTFDTARFCPEDIAAVAVSCFIDNKGCDWVAFKRLLAMTTEEFIEAIATIIGPMPNIKGTTISLTVAGIDFTLKVRKDGIAILKQV